MAKNIELFNAVINCSYFLLHISSFTYLSNGRFFQVLKFLVCYKFQLLILVTCTVGKDFLAINISLSLDPTASSTVPKGFISCNPIANFYKYLLSQWNYFQKILVSTYNSKCPPLFRVSDVRSRLSIHKFRDLDEDEGSFPYM